MWAKMSIRGGLKVNTRQRIKLQKVMGQKHEQRKQRMKTKKAQTCRKKNAEEQGGDNVARVGRRCQSHVVANRVSAGIT